MKNINSMLESVDTKILSDNETLEQFKMFKKGDMDARDQLVFSNIHSVIKYARINATSEEDFKELFSIGVVALIDSINSYDINKNLNLKDYISKCVELSITSHLQEKEKRHTFRIKNAISEGSANVFDNLEEKELLNTVRELCSNFSLKEQEIIKLYFGFNDRCYEIMEISQKLNYSNSWITSVINKVLRELRSNLTNEGATSKQIGKRKTKKKKKVLTN